MKDGDYPAVHIGQCGNNCSDEVFARNGNVKLFQIKMLKLSLKLVLKLPEGEEVALNGWLRANGDTTV